MKQLPFACYCSICSGELDFDVRLDDNGEVRITLEGCPDCLDERLNAELDEMKAAS